MTANSIPASWIVAINPSVISAGGNPLSMNSVLLTNDTSIPIGTVQSFSTAADVGGWFGANATESTLASIYFNGFSISSIKPSALWLAQYPSTDVAAYIRGGAYTGTLVQLGTLSGTLICTVDGTVKTSSTINFSGVGSYSAAAGLITTAFGSGVTASWDALRSAFVLTSATAGVNSSVTFCTGTLSTNLNMTSATGAVLSQGTAAAIIPATHATLTGGTLGSITLSAMKLISGTLTCAINGSLVTTPTLNFSGISALGDVAALITTAFSSAVTASWDSVNVKVILTDPLTGSTSTISACSGTASTALGLTVATGAIAVQGADAQSNPAATLNGITGITQNWVTFFTTFEPNTQGKEAFQNWSALQNNQYLYIAWDSDVLAENSNATTTFGNICKTNSLTGVQCVWPSSDKAAFVAGSYASVNYSEKNGKVVLAGKSQDGLLPDVTDQTTADNLIGNGYSFYCAIATRNQRFIEFQNGNMPGPWMWGDAYVDQIYMMDQMKLNLLTLLSNTKSLPHNRVGGRMVYQSLMDPIKQFVNFGSIMPGTQPSDQEIVVVNQEAGVDISGPLATQGWYLQIGVATAQNRALRVSPPCNFWYMQGQSIQKITLPSYAVQ